MEVKKINVEQENGRRQLKPVKAASKVQNRPAFTDVGNKLTTNRIQSVAIKKPAISTQNQCLNNLKKPQKCISHVGEKKKEVQATANDEKQVFKREETLQSLSKITLTNDVEKTTSYSSKELYGILELEDKEEDPLLVSEYINDIINYLMQLENKYIISRHFLNGEHKSTPRMRAVLVNWIAEVNCNFKFLTETFHLSVAIIDRYLEINRKIGRETLQLVGTTALFIAAKYEEMYVPEINEFVYICDGAFTKSQLFKMEQDILKQLEFCLGRPLSIHFLRRFNKIEKVTPTQHNLGKYVLELALQEYELSHIKPSLQAAAACCLSLSIVGNKNPSDAWNNTLKIYSKYTFENIKPVIAHYCEILLKVDGSKFQAIRNKYANSSCSKISMNLKLKGRFVENIKEICTKK